MGESQCIKFGEGGVNTMKHSFYKGFIVVVVVIHEDLMSPRKNLVLL